jgi:DNA-binding CsgD family transcriptional regulator
LPIEKLGSALPRTACYYRFPNVRGLDESLDDTHKRRVQQHGPTFPGLSRHFLIGAGVSRALTASAGAPTVAGAACARPREAEAQQAIAGATALMPKEIGLTMNIHEDTVKWHVKNLLAKLSAGTCRQVVSRARLMGILVPAT